MMASRVSRLLWRLAVSRMFETTTIFSMLDLENLLQKKLGLYAVNKKSTDLLDTPGIVPTGFGKSQIYISFVFLSRH